MTSGNTRLAYTAFMPRGDSLENVTLSAEKELTEAARARAREERTTLNDAFRSWLEAYARREPRADRAIALIHRLQGYARTGGRRFTRDEMN